MTMIMIMINICFVRLAGYISSLSTCSCKQQSLPQGGGRGGIPYERDWDAQLSLLGLHVKKYIKIIYFQFVLFTRFMQFRFTTVSFRVKKKGWATLGLSPLGSFRVFIQIYERILAHFIWSPLGSTL